MPSTYENLESMNNAENGIAAIATKLGCKAYTENGRIKFEGSVGNVKKVWAVIGADIIARDDIAYPTRTAWDCFVDGEYMGSILANRDYTFCYSYTIA
jgi:hypothetical protein